MKETYVVLDVETQKSFDEVGGRNFDRLGISVAGIYRDSIKTYEAYEEKELGALNQILSEAELIIGFNSKCFDYIVLQPYLKVPLSKLPTLDIMDELKLILGHRVSLNSVAKGTLGIGKNGDGLEAIALYKRGEIEKIKKYCLNDVKLTKEIYEFGIKNQWVKYLSKDGSRTLQVSVKWTSCRAQPQMRQEELLF